MNSNQLKTLPQYIAPQHLSSRLMGKIADCRIKAIKDFLIRIFIRKYGVNLDEAEISDPLQYQSFNEFFTRSLKPEARPIVQDKSTIISPVDGSISQIGPIQQQRLIQAKGFDFTTTELLGGDQDMAQQFQQGLFTTIYLSPVDYHRIHMPYTGKLRQMTYIPGKLFSVNDRTAQTVPKLFARNERVVCLFDTEFGPMAVVLVGAFFVASMATVWAGDIAPNPSSNIKTWHYQDSDITLQKGEELGRFKFGSTVILLFPKDVMYWQAQWQAQQSIQLGQKLGTLIS